jgi:enoyl-CoA hydratase/carnithine racemase
MLHLQVLITRQGAVVIVVLNRPKALNALTLQMMKTMQGLYLNLISSFLNSEDRQGGIPKIVILKGAGEKVDHPACRSSCVAVETCIQHGMQEHLF